MNRLRVDHLVAGYGRRIVLSELSLPLMDAGQVIALVGPNGSGKSTVMRAIAGLIHVRGLILLGEVDLAPLSLSARSRHVRYLPQTQPNPPLLVLETLITALKINPPARADFDARRTAMAALDRLGIAGLALAPMNQLSGGQRQLAALARVIAHPAPLILLDEPTNALDLKSQFTVMSIVRELAEAGAIVVVVLHDLELAARWADAVAVLDRGRLYAASSPSEAITSRMMSDVYHVSARVERCSRGTLTVVVDAPTIPQSNQRTARLSS